MVSCGVVGGFGWVRVETCVHVGRDTGVCGGPREEGWWLRLFGCEKGEGL